MSIVVSFVVDDDDKFFFLKTTLSPDNNNDCCVIIPFHHRNVFCGNHFFFLWSCDIEINTWSMNEWMIESSTTTNDRMFITHQLIKLNRMKFVTAKWKNKIKSSFDLEISFYINSAIYVCDDELIFRSLIIIGFFSFDFVIVDDDDDDDNHDYCIIAPILFFSLFNQLSSAYFVIYYLGDFGLFFRCIFFDV